MCSNNRLEIFNYSFYLASFNSLSNIYIYIYTRMTSYDVRLTYSLSNIYIYIYIYTYDIIRCTSYLSSYLY